VLFRQFGWRRVRELSRRALFVLFGGSDSRRHSAGRWKRYLRGKYRQEADAITQYTLDQTDYAGAYSRVLVSATSRLRMVTGFEGNQLLPDNSWILYRQEFLNYQRPDMWMAMYPPYPPNGGFGSPRTFVPMAR
jgi:hypothetical protein